MVSVSVALLLARLGSSVGAATATVAVLVKVPVAVGLRVAMIVKVMVPALGIVRLLRLMLPAWAPPGRPVTPAEPTAVQLTPLSWDEKLSVALTPEAVFGPLLVTVTV